MVVFGIDYLLNSGCQLLSLKLEGSVRLIFCYINYTLLLDFREKCVILKKYLFVCCCPTKRKRRISHINNIGQNITLAFIN